LTAVRSAARWKVPYGIISGASDRRKGHSII
jgi:hypothetical protein